MLRFVADAMNDGEYSNNIMNEEKSITVDSIIVQSTQYYSEDYLIVTFLSVEAANRKLDHNNFVSKSFPS
jgi:hypothetical protein